MMHNDLSSSSRSNDNVQSCVSSELIDTRLENINTSYLSSAFNDLV